MNPGISLQRRQMTETKTRGHIEDNNECHGGRNLIRIQREHGASTGSSPADGEILKPRRWHSDLIVVVKASVTLTITIH